MSYQPLPFQKTTIDRMLAKPVFGVFLSPGAGKTAITLATLSRLREEGGMTGALVIAPQRPLRLTWRQEGQKWGFPLTFSLVHGSEKERLRALQAKADVYLINPENVAWLANRQASDLPPFDVLVVDESQKFKNATTLRSKALRALLPFFRRRYILSGTPAAEGVLDLFNQVRILDNGRRLGRTLTAFREAYCWEEVLPFGCRKWHPNEGAQEEIFTRIADVCQRVDASLYLQMPERIDNVVTVESRKAVEACRQIRDERFPGLRSPNPASKINSMRQATGGALYLSPDGEETGPVVDLHGDKISALIDLIDQQQGDPLLVCVGYRHEIERIRAGVKESLGIDVPDISGGTSPKKSDDLVEAWNAGKLPVLVIHPASCSTGLNLQSGGRSLVWFTLPWSLDQYIQTNARVCRQGQSRGVIIHHLVVPGTVDEVVLESLRSKTSTQESLYESLEAYVKAVG